MKKLVSYVLAMVLCVASCLAMTGCGEKTDYTVGICQLMEHESLDKATKGFQDALVAELGEGNVNFDLQNAAGDTNTCATIVNSFVSNDVDLIMANATPALQAAAAATGDIPILGTSVTEYGVALEIKDFNGTVGDNISGTSDLAPLDKQAAMITEWCPEAKSVGLLYCSKEANSQYQVDVVKAELEKIELQKSIKTTAKAVFDRVTDSLGISPRVRSLSKAFDESQAQIKDMDAQMKEQEELHKSQLIYQQETFKCENEKQLETIASKDETIAILCRQNTMLDKEMGELVDKYNRIQAKAERLEKERDGFRTLVESKNHCIRETYFILFDNIEPRSLEKLGDLGLRQLIGKESWEKLKHLDDISMSQSIKKGPRL